MFLLGYWLNLIGVTDDAVIMTENNVQVHVVSVNVCNVILSDVGMIDLMISGKQQCTNASRLLERIQAVQDQEI